MAFMGCNVVEGEGVGIVLSTGFKNQLSKIAAQVTGVKAVPTSLQSDINRFVTIIGTITFTTTVVVVLEWAFYLHVQHRSYMNPSQMIANAISVLVAYVPEGLPLALSMGLTIISTRLCVSHHVLLKKLSTVETLGSMSMLASDKTGTLTQNLMTVTGLISSEKVFSDEDIANAPTPIRHAVLRLSTLCNQAQLEQLPGASGRVAVGSNGIDKALLQFAESENAVEICKLTYRVKVMMPFNSATKLSATVVNGPYTTVLEKANANAVTTDSHLVDFVLVKGAPEYILARCSSVMGDSGVSTPLTPSVLAEIKRNLELVSCTGRRVIALAQSPELVPCATYRVEPKPNFPLEGLVFLACVAVSDPPREGVREAVTELRGAGIKVAMVTGDAASTAAAIARQVGIIDEQSRADSFRNFREQGSGRDDVERGLVGVEEYTHPQGNPAVVVEGKDLESITPGGWDYIFQHDEMVFARTTPEQKLQIVKESQARGFRVGVTGDGVNDSPALKRADVGIAMNSGSDVARDAAAIVLLKDDFRAIVHGVRAGRTIFNNLRKVIGYQIAAGSWSELLPVLATFFLGMPQPLSSFLMIIICCVTDVFAGVALTNELPERTIMQQPPRNPKKSPLVDMKLIGYSYLYYGSLQSLGAFTTYFLYMSSRGPTNQVPNPLPATDDSVQNVHFPVGYKPTQLIGAWTWADDDSVPLDSDMSAAQSTASSIFFVTLIVAQMGHLLSIRRKTPYFSDAILGSGGGGVLARIWKELKESKPLPAILIAWIGAVCTANLFNEVPAIQKACGTSHVPPKFWAIAFGWSACWFVIGEVRKWIILIFPNSIIAKMAW